MFITISSIFIFILILNIPIKISIRNIKTSNRLNIKILFINIKINNKLFSTNNKIDLSILKNLNKIFKHIDILRFNILIYHNIDNNLFYYYSLKAIINSYIHNHFRSINNCSYKLVLCNNSNIDFNIKINIRIIDGFYIIWRIYGPKGKYAFKGKFR